jgi:hypothetical protein
MDLDREMGTKVNGEWEKKKKNIICVGVLRYNIAYTISFLVFFFFFFFWRCGGDGVSCKVYIKLVCSVWLFGRAGRWMDGWTDGGLMYVCAGRSAAVVVVSADEARLASSHTKEETSSLI